MTKDDEALASIGPPPRRALGRAQLVARRQTLARIDSQALRADVDELLDPGHVVRAEPGGDAPE